MISGAENACAVTELKNVLGAFARLRKATFSVIRCVCWSARMEQLSFHWTDFHENRYWRIFMKI